MRKGYGSQSNLGGWRFSVGSVPLDERRSREGNEENVCALQLSCSRCSDRADGAKRCEQEKRRGAGKGVRVSLPHPYLLIFRPLSYFAQQSTISTPGIS